MSNTMREDQITQLKRAVGEAAAARVQSGMTVGLGTGSTTTFAIASLGERLRSGKLRNLRGVPTSYAAAALAREHGIQLTTLDDVFHDGAGKIDIAIDGADEVAPDLSLIKGRGAAQLGEKIVDSLASVLIVVVDEAKLVQRLGAAQPVPVEVLPLAVAPVMRAVERLGGAPTLRLASAKDGPVITDQGNMVLDVKFDGIDDAAALERTLNNIPGVLENGLFVGVAGVVLVGEMVEGEPRVREMRRP